ncbi:hypothetical protein [Flagellimonas onchidii]|uniref:hypothetical protein n=1 Tax=Flagellimonas onchidii TaxID=2562684 RepID=UPI0010A5FAA5|nr:hypothetical protein [Allomuricauda onchidii]
MTDSNKPPIWFWMVSVLALLWNSMGVYNYLYTKFNQVEMLEAMTQEQRALFEGIPAWATAAFALAVFSGVIASIGLLLRKKWAKPLFVVSLVTAVIQFINWLFLQNAAEVYGGAAYTMPILVVVIGLALIYFSKKAIQKGWLT